MRADEPGTQQARWAYLVNEWGVRFGYGLGSVFFIAAALLSVPEVITDD